LHRAQYTGIDAQNKEGRPHFDKWLEGKIAYISMIDAKKGAALKAALAAAGSKK
jgi:hypothetical protein